MNDYTNDPTHPPAGDLPTVVAGLDRLRAVPDDVLTDLVTRDGLCMWAFDRADIPEMTGHVSADRELAAWLCAGCPVQHECLELELRTAGAMTTGVWGALPEDDRRALYLVWRARRANPADGDQSQAGGQPA